jgi:hypothetical protein
MKTTMYRNGLYGLLTLVLVASLGCSAGNQDSSPASTESPSEQKSETTMPKQSQELVVQNSSGDTTVSIRPAENGAELVDGSGQTVATYAMTEADDAQKVEIKDASGQVTGYINIKGRTYTVEDASQQPLYLFRTGGEQRHRFVNPADENLYVLKVNDSGYVIRNAEKQVTARAKGGNKQAVLQSAEKQPVLQAQAMSPLALAVFGFEELSQEQQGALAYAVNLRGGRDVKASKKTDQGDAATPKNKRKGENAPAAAGGAAESPAAESPAAE